MEDCDVVTSERIPVVPMSSSPGKEAGVGEGAPAKVPENGAKVMESQKPCNIDPCVIFWFSNGEHKFPEADVGKLKRCTRNCSSRDERGTPSLEDSLESIDIPVSYSLVGPPNFNLATGAVGFEKKLLPTDGPDVSDGPLDPCGLDNGTSNDNGL